MGMLDRFRDRALVLTAHILEGVMTCRSLDTLRDRMMILLTGEVFQGACLIVSKGMTQTQERGH